MDGGSSSGAIPFADAPVVPDAFHEYRGRYDNGGVAVVWDNGSSASRVGWDVCDRPLLTFRPVVSRAKKEKKVEAEVLVGSDIACLDAAKGLKTPFERNVVIGAELQVWTQSGIDFLIRIGMSERRKRCSPTASLTWASTATGPSTIPSS